MPPPTELCSPTLNRLRDRLTLETRAEVYFDPGMRGLYATDASLYQIEPVGVVVPRTTDDVISTVRIAAEEDVAIVPRGGVTSLSGQTIAAWSWIDVSKYHKRVSSQHHTTITPHVPPLPVSL